ncbi:MAG: hypothetical protein K6T16_00635 [Candidatus Pacearchaeota archaeon]|nr:hypothetical protein [Candidatus Pacearchaeota archaeon]
MKFSEALQELRRKSKKRNFDQTLDLIINLKNFDPKRESISTFVVLPYAIKKKKICAFLENPSRSVDYVITKDEIEQIGPKEIKKLTKEYDFFISSAKLMPKIAAKFGKILGSTGKMPDPKMGSVLMMEREDLILAVTKKLSNMVKIRAKEASVKIGIGKESMPDKELIENAEAVFRTVFSELPKKELNLRSVMLKFTMSSPVKVPR